MLCLFFKTVIIHNNELADKSMEEQHPNTSKWYEQITPKRRTVFKNMYWYSLVAIWMVLFYCGFVFFPLHICVTKCDTLPNFSE